MITFDKAIDIHSHINHGAKYDSVPEEYGKTYCAGLDFLMSEYDSAGILCGAYSTFDSVLSAENIPSENEYMFSMAQKEKRAFSWIVVHPDNKESFIQAEKMLKSGKTLGIKIHPPCHKYSAAERGDEIFDFANQLKVWVLMHPDSIPEMPRLADQYPDMNLIIAHIGGEDHINAVLNAKQQNIYTDTSGIASSKNNIIEYAVSKIGSEHILFGTDTYSCGFQRGRIDYARISDKDKENILYRNAKNLFKENFINF